MHKERAEAFFLCERRRRLRILDVRAADLQEEMTEQRFSVPSDPTKTAATKRTSQRAKRAVKHSAMREQCKISTASVGNRAPPHGEGASGGVLPLRATTTAADPKRDARAVQKHSITSRANV